MSDKKYTLADLREGKIAVHTGAGKKLKKFLKACERAGYVWNSGDKPTGFRPVFVGKELAIGCSPKLAKKPEALLHAPAAIWAKTGYEIVEFSDISLKEPGSVPKFRVVIDCDGDLTTATLMREGKTVKTATAKRNPADRFSLAIGAGLALERLLGEKTQATTADTEETTDTAGASKKDPDEFKVGDRVECISNECWNRPLVGKLGTVVRTTGIGTVGVAFDDDIDGHNCGGRCKNGHGWALQARSLRHVEG